MSTSPAAMECWWEDLDLVGLFLADTLHVGGQMRVVAPEID